MAVQNKGWVLLVEDDVVFSMLFCRFWKGRAPGVEVKVATSLLEFRDALAQRETPPLLVIMDQNLPDGNGHEAVSSLTIPCCRWSAQESPGVQLKPQGKDQFQESIEALVQAANIITP